jgi:deazaflavin-dependent oxidoreductase (nitroreductase family)
VRDVRAPNNHAVRLPKWLPAANRIIIGLQRLGLPIGTMRTLTVVGRRSGVPRTTPVSPFTVDGQRYLISIPGTAWVSNARAAGEATLARGRRAERVRLIEVPEADRAPILSQFPRLVPHGVRFFVMTGVVSAPTAEAFADAAPRCAVFKVEQLG